MRFAVTFLIVIMVVSAVVSQEDETGENRIKNEISHTSEFAGDKIRRLRDEVIKTENEIVRLLSTRRKKSKMRFAVTFLLVIMTVSAAVSHENETNENISNNIRVFGSSAFSDDFEEEAERHKTAEKIACTENTLNLNESRLVATTD
ncbi:hypothetical protein KQX54_005075 [Cotesia glomerata]|uniref:Uncharacterized protein n=1 Tax=Cotesia glomerata TaxID=32391 RepID=A0AAV7ITH7_COTGL|nr:hypothetical protein KQX54_005075 [Cotesia glomerata]